MIQDLTPTSKRSQVLFLNVKAFPCNLPERICTYQKLLVLLPTETNSERSLTYESD